MDIEVILHSNNTIETDIYYKETNAHDYLPYNSAHPKHGKDNLAKRIIAFVSNDEKVEMRLKELKNWLKYWNYPDSVINQSFYNPKLQGSVSFTDDSKSIPFVTIYYENIDNEKMVTKIRSKLSNVQSRHLSEVFKNKNVIPSQKQPKNLLQLLARTRFNTEIYAFQQQNRLFKCIDKRWKICSLYIVEGHNFTMSNNMRWELRSHVTCRSVNIIYYLKCNMCKKKETYIGKTVGDNIVGFKSRMNQHISDSRMGNSKCKFLIHDYKCGLKSKCLKEQFFEINIVMRLKSSSQLETHENHFHKKGYDTLNCPEHLKK